MTSLLPVFVGYDERERDGYEVCVSSLARASSARMFHYVVRLDQTLLRQAGLYWRDWHLAENGLDMIDDLDGKPFSTDFSFSRFLVPAASLYQGWALYCDCDFLFLGDLAELMALADPRFAVMVVKHEHEPVEQHKMGGLVQSRYYRKNWSSLMLWNCAHPLNSDLSPEVVNGRPGRWLHGFSWLKDDEIGELPPAWNWLAGVSEPLKEQPQAVHFTLGLPSLAGYENQPFADLWREERLRLDTPLDGEDKRRGTGAGTVSLARGISVPQLEGE